MYREHLFIITELLGPSVAMHCCTLGQERFRAAQRLEDPHERARAFQVPAPPRGGHSVACLGAWPWLASLCWACPGRLVPLLALLRPEGTAPTGRVAL